MQEVLQEKEIFRGYELKSWNFSPRIYKILAFSAIFNIAALALFAQSNLLTAKGCDSPFVSTVCQVLDTIYVGNKLFGTDGDYVVKEYNRTEIGEDDEITFINVENISPPVAYPEGYFGLANPEQYTFDENGNMVPNNTFANMTPNIPGIPNSSPPLINSTPNLPTPNKPISGEEPGNPFAIVNDPTRAGNGKSSKKNPTIPDNSPDELPKLGGDETANTDQNRPKVDEKTASNSKPIAEVEINKKPFQDLGKMVSAKWSIEADSADNKVELKPFKVSLNAKLTKKLIKDEDGEEREVVALDPKKSKWIDLPKEESGDPELVEIAKQAIEAVGDSGFLGHLYNLDLKDLKINLTQKGEKLYVTIESEQPTENLAKTVASGLNTLLGFARSTVKGEDEKVLLNAAQAPTNVGKRFVMNVELDKAVVQEMLVRKLAEEAKKEAEKKKQNPNNSTAATFNSNTNSGK